MEKNLPSSQRVVTAPPLEADIRWMDRLKERIISAATFPVMFLGTACYALAMWFVEYNDEAAH
jgi:hypothetical protein